MQVFELNPTELPRDRDRDRVAPNQPKSLLQGINVEVVPRESELSYYNCTYETIILPCFGLLEFGSLTCHTTFHL